jgi:hypothetical protein
MRSTHLTVYRSIWFISISRVRAAQGLPFVIVFTGSIDLFDFHNLFSLVGLPEVYYIDHKALFLGGP